VRGVRRACLRRRGTAFVEKVKPLLDSRCVSCHGPDKVKGGLRLDSRDGVLKAGESGLPSVVPGKPAESLLLQAVMHSKKDLEMPPKDRLTSNDVAVLERWIRDGAPWPRAEVIAAPHGGSNPANGLGMPGAISASHRAHLRRARLDLWSLKPVKLVDRPQ